MRTQSIEISQIASNTSVETPFLFFDGGFHSLKNLHEESVQDLLLSAFPEGLEPIEKKHTVYNFEVEDTHTYIAGGYRVHNRSTLSYWDPEKYGEIQSITTDSDGNLVVVTETDIGEYGRSSRLV